MRTAATTASRNPKIDQSLRLLPQPQNKHGRGPATYTQLTNSSKREQVATPERRGNTGAAAHAAGSVERHATAGAAKSVSQTT
jgi:hypothetical protein